MTMFIGELEFQDIPIDNFLPFSFVTNIILIIFVFFVVITLMNLLNGLAVQDIGVLVKEAEIVGIKSRYFLFYTNQLLSGLQRSVT